MDTLHAYALAAGLAWASGIRLYAAVFLAGLLGRLQVVHLPEGLAVLQDNWVLGAAGVLMVGEFLADKVPAFDSAWDAVHTFIRIPAGVLLSWASFAIRRRRCSWPRPCSAAPSPRARTSPRPVAVPSSTPRPSPSATGAPV